MPTESLRALVAGLFDYAGLFPPAGQGMQRAVESYARHRMGEHAWMLGRFVCAASRLGELSEHGAALMPGTYATSGYREHADVLEPWGVTVVADLPLEDALARIAEFNERHSREDRGLARADAVEIRAESASFIDETLDAVPDDLLPFYEVPVEGDCRGMVAALAGSGACAKVRCGGVVPGAIPASQRLAAFLHACAAGDVPFKATAGLHHPVRGERPLTYEPSPPRAVMHGFVNVFLAAVAARTGEAGPGELASMLEEREPGAFAFTGEAASWRGRGWSVEEVAGARDAFAVSIGSCSFEEPVADLRGLGWL